VRRAIAATVGYLLGSVMVAPWLARRHGVDLYRTADGNPGAWNALEQLGPRRAWIAFVGDGVKAALAGALGLLLGGWWSGFAGVAGAMGGHIAPLGRPRRGGKGVMCLVGGMLPLAPLAWSVCLGICLLVARMRSFAWGVRAALIALPFVQAATGPIVRVKATGVLMSLMGGAFLLRRTPARASDEPGAASTG
jgi:acyl phosphate:glycerol-3-phosphate acyltransferase